MDFITPDGEFYIASVTGGGQYILPNGEFIIEAEAEPGGITVVQIERGRSVGRGILRGV